jgi:hypothetical protein
VIIRKSSRQNGVALLGIGLRTVGVVSEVGRGRSNGEMKKIKRNIGVEGGKKGGKGTRN